VLIVASSLDPALMLEAMRAGVTECVPEPFSNTDLEAAVARLVGARQPATGGQVFAFVGAKGGVGTTTTAVNVATALSAASSGRPCSLTSTWLTGMPPCSSRGTEVLRRGRPREHAQTGRGVLQEPGHAKQVGPGRAGFVRPGPGGCGSKPGHPAPREFSARMYHYTVLDVPRSDASALDALDASSKVVIVANQELRPCVMRRGLRRP